MQKQQVKLPHFYSFVLFGVYFGMGEATIITLYFYDGQSELSGM